MSAIKKYPAGGASEDGDSGWGTAVTVGTGLVEASIYGPQGGWYGGDWMSPEQAEALGMGLIVAAAEARERNKPSVPLPSHTKELATT